MKWRTLIITVFLMWLGAIFGLPKIAQAIIVRCHVAGTTGCWDCGEGTKYASNDSPTLYNGYGPIWFTGENCTGAQYSLSGASTTRLDTQVACAANGSGTCYGYQYAPLAVYSIGDGFGSCSVAPFGVPSAFAYNPTINACSWYVNTLPTLTTSVSNPSTWVNSTSKLNISGTITDPDTQNYTVSYSLSTTTTPGVWTVCRSASSTRKWG